MKVEFNTVDHNSRDILKLPEGPINSSTDLLKHRKSTKSKARQSKYVYDIEDDILKKQSLKIERDQKTFGAKDMFQNLTGGEALRNSQELHK